MKRLLFVLMLSSACVDNHVAGDGADLGSYSTDSLMLEHDGVTFSLCDAGVGKIMGAGSVLCPAATMDRGSGPTYHTQNCTPQMDIAYSFAIIFIGDADALAPGTSFDLSDPNHGKHIVVELNSVENQVETDYCSELATAPATPVSGTVQVTRSDLDPSSGLGLFAVLSNIVLPAVDGGTPMHIVSGRLYF